MSIDNSAVFEFSEESDIDFMKHTFIREKSLSRYNCQYKEVDWFEYSEEEKEAVKKPRRSRTRASPPKVKDMNDEYSRRYFRWLFHNNFRAGDYVVTLTFANPTNKKQAQKDFANYIKRLRRLYAKLGLELKYLYVYEGRSKGTRPHFHVVINSGAGVNRDDIERLWKLGLTQSRRMQPDDGGELCEALCEYMSKEFKRAAKFERSWNCSTNLLRPDTVTDDNSVSKKRMRKMQDAARNDEVKKYVERLYIGWALVSYYIGTNEITGRPFARFKLVRKKKYRHYVSLYKAVRRKGKSP
ncbi:MAG: hypothetical protein OSJ43_14875 [Oscillospiraceae bacterium]|nr:hypothetical protein [Oscillospiraceae bacterium]